MKISFIISLWGYNVYETANWGELSVEINASEAVDMRFNRPDMRIPTQERPFLKSH